MTNDPKEPGSLRRPLPDDELYFEQDPLISGMFNAVNPETAKRPLQMITFPNNGSCVQEMFLREKLAEALRERISVPEADAAQVRESVEGFLKAKLPDPSSRADWKVSFKPVVDKDNAIGFSWTASFPTTVIRLTFTAHRRSFTLTKRPHGSMRQRRRLFMAVRHSTPKPPAAQESAQRLPESNFTGEDPVIDTGVSFDWIESDQDRLAGNVRSFLNRWIDLFEKPPENTPTPLTMLLDEIQAKWVSGDDTPIHVEHVAVSQLPDGGYEITIVPRDPSKFIKTAFNF